MSFTDVILLVVFVIVWVVLVTRVAPRFGVPT